MAMEKAKEVVSANPVIVFSKTYCGSCKEVGEFLLQLGANYKIVDLDVEKIASSIDFCKRPLHYLGDAGLEPGLSCFHRDFEFTFQSQPLPAMLKGDGAEIQSALAEWTGQRFVPNIFIGGNHIGGKSDLLNKHKEGYLIPLLTEAGALPSPNPSVST